MRNLKEYPLDAEEADLILSELYDSVYDIKRMGDMRPYTIRTIREFIASRPDEFNLFVTKEIK